MNASKENARRALTILQMNSIITREEAVFVRKFLEAAIKKLPGEASRCFRLPSTTDAK